MRLCSAMACLNHPHRSFRGTRAGVSVQHARRVFSGHSSTKGEVMSSRVREDVLAVGPGKTALTLFLRSSEDGADLDHGPVCSRYDQESAPLVSASTIFPLDRQQPIVSLTACFARDTPPRLPPESAHRHTADLRGCPLATAPRSRRAGTRDRLGTPRRRTRRTATSDECDG